MTWFHQKWIVKIKIKTANKTDGKQFKKISTFGFGIRPKAGRPARIFSKKVGQSLFVGRPDFDWNRVMEVGTARPVSLYTKLNNKIIRVKTM